MSVANTLERQMLDLINDEREALGLDALQLEVNLNDSSEDHSNWMLTSDKFSHTGNGGSSATDRMRAADFDFSGSWSSGENIAWQSERGASGLSDDVVDLHESLMNSPGHRANILNPNFDYIGIGIERGDFKGWDGVVVTQNFASTGGSVDLDEGNSDPAKQAPATEAPVVELQPEPKTETPEEPIKTAQPVETEEPVETRKPVETKKPVQTEEPVEAKKPVETEEPVETKKPVETKQPVETEEPVEAEEPVQTAQPTQPEPAPSVDDGDDNSAPVVTVDDIVLAKVWGERATRLDKFLQVEDDDGDTPEWFELLDTEGRDNFRFRGEGRIDADEPFRFDADDLDMIRVRVDRKVGETELQVRAFDGEDVSEWASFTLTTQSSDDWWYAA